MAQNKKSHQSSPIIIFIMLCIVFFGAHTIYTIGYDDGIKHQNEQHATTSLKMEK